MREARKAAQAVLQHVEADAHRERGGGGAGRVLRVVLAAQRADAAELCDLAARAARGAHDGAVLDMDAGGQRVLDRDPHHVLAGAIEPVGDVAAETIVDADDRGAAGLHAGDEALLHRSVMRDGAVTVDVVLADIEQNADGGIERGREVDLVGRHLDDVDAARARRLQRQDRGADIAAHLGVVAGDLCEMRDQRRRGRFAVGAGDRDERRVRRVPPPLAAEQLDVADHLDSRPRAPSARSSAAPDGSAARRARARALRNSPRRRCADRR